MEKINIGIFDSGIGGFSILKQIFRIFPSDRVNVHYIADQKYVPYGNKTDDEIKLRSLEISKELIEDRKCSLIIVACNSATATSISYLREAFDIPFVGVEPYINYFNKIETNKEVKPVLLVTNVTSDSVKLLELKFKLDPINKITTYACTRLASSIEKIFQNGMSASLRAKVESELDPLKARGFTHAILGCTHYPLISELIEEILELKCVSPCPHVAKRAFDLLEFSNSSGDKNEENKFFFKSTERNSWTEISQFL